MGFILLGHGGMDVQAVTPGMEMVAIPQGTRIQFYVDSNQTLMIGAKDLLNWDQVTPPWNPLDSSHLTYNFCLTNTGDMFDGALSSNPYPGGHSPIRPGVNGAPDPLYLCTGTPETCPTTPQQVAQGAEHNCDGILTHLRGEDIHWVACAALWNAEKATMDIWMSNRPGAVSIGVSPDWVPDSEADKEFLAQWNRHNLDSLDPARGHRIPFALGGGTLVIGNCVETSKYAAYARGAEDAVEGLARVSLRGLEFQGNIPKSKHRMVQNLVRPYYSGNVSFRAITPY